jgi:phenylpropionate dioxygenase-like ring-hydroxylating dioxygenase large terminal subunit
MSLLDDPNKTESLEGLAITASGLDRNGPTLVPVDRYISPEWAAIEAEKVWPHVWQVACSVDHVAEPGDFYEYRCGWISILIVRGDHGELRAFQNACRHRGNAICEGTGSGLAELRCPYHRWAWTTEGKLWQVPNRKGFGHLDNDDYALIPAQVDTFGRIVFVNLDMDAMPLGEWLEGIPDDLSWCPLDDYRCTAQVVTPMPSNWKVVAEGFSETYHIQGIHREMLGHIDDVDAPQKLWHRHGMSYQNYGVPSPRLGKNGTPEVVWTTWLNNMGERLGVPKDTPPPDVPEGLTMQDVIAQGIIDHCASQGVDISMHDNVRICAISQYNLFPNASMLFMPDMFSVLSSRPGPTPDESQFVMMSFRRVAPGAPRSTPLTAEVPAGTDFGFVMNQDVGIMKTAQRGLHQPGLTHLALSAEECRVINLHRNLDEWCGTGD